jgi:septum formation protein
VEEATRGAPEDVVVENARRKARAVAISAEDAGITVALEAGAVGERSGVARSEVAFAELDASTLDLYVASGEWRDRAGGYAIQGLGSLLVERVEGDFSNVVGLPLPLLFQLVPQAGEAAARGR